MEFIPRADYILINQTDIQFEKGGIDIPIILHMHCHRYGPSVNDPDVLLMSSWEMEDWYLKFYRIEWYSIPVKKLFLPAVNPTVFTPGYKSIEGITHLGFDVGDFAMCTEKQPSWVLQDFFQPAQELVQFIEAHPEAFNSFNYPLPFTRYRDLLQKCEALVVAVGKHHCLSRRIMEALACKTLPIILVENFQVHTFFETIGLKTHSIGFTSHEELEGIAKMYGTETVRKGHAEIIEDGYQWVLANHTYAHRALELLQLLGLQPEFPDLQIGGIIENG